MSPRKLPKLKQQPGRDIGMSGSGTLVQSLLQQGLIDELNLLVYPVVLGRGKRLFQDGSNLNLKLTQSKTSELGRLADHLPGGVVGGRSGCGAHRSTSHRLSSRSSPLSMIGDGRANSKPVGFELARA